MVFQFSKCMEDGPLHHLSLLLLSLRHTSHIYVIITSSLQNISLSLHHPSLSSVGSLEVAVRESNEGNDAIDCQAGSCCSVHVAADVEQSLPTPCYTA